MLEGSMGDAGDAWDALGRTEMLEQVWKTGQGMLG